MCRVSAIGCTTVGAPATLPPLHSVSVGPYRRGGVEPVSGQDVVATPGCGRQRGPPDGGSTGRRRISGGSSRWSPTLSISWSSPRFVQTCRVRQRQHAFRTVRRRPHVKAQPELNDLRRLVRPRIRVAGKRRNEGIRDASGRQTRDVDRQRAACAVAAFGARKLGCPTLASPASFPQQNRLAPRSLGRSSHALVVDAWSRSRVVCWTRSIRTSQISPVVG